MYKHIIFLYILNKKKKKRQKFSGGLISKVFILSQNIHKIKKIVL
jgi:hypothetical protein